MAPAEEQDLEPIVQELIAEYESKRAIANPGYRYFRSPKYDKSFYKAAAICHASGYVPSAFVQAAWNSIENKAHFYPTLLGTARMGCVAEKFIDEVSIDYKKQWDQQVDVIKNYVLLAGWDPHDVLMKADNGLYGWFRIVSTEKPDNEIIDKYLAIAKQEMSQKLLDFLKERNLDYTRIVPEDYGN